MKFLTLMLLASMSHSSFAQSFKFGNDVKRFQDGNYTRGSKCNIHSAQSNIYSNSGNGNSRYTVQINGENISKSVDSSRRRPISVLLNIYKEYVDRVYTEQCSFPPVKESCEIKSNRHGYLIYRGGQPFGTEHRYGSKARSDDHSRANVISRDQAVTMLNMMRLMHLCNN
jgi:hypothetical protein